MRTGSGGGSGARHRHARRLAGKVGDRRGTSRPNRSSTSCAAWAARPARATTCRARWWPRTSSCCSTASRSTAGEPAARPAEPAGCCITGPPQRSRSLLEAAVDRTGAASIAARQARRGRKLRNWSMARSMRRGSSSWPDLRQHHRQRHVGAQRHQAGAPPLPALPCGSTASSRPAAGAGGGVARRMPGSVA